MVLRRPLELISLVGYVAWLTGLLAFGGWGSATGTAIIGLGSILVIACMAAELVLRGRDSRRARDAAAPGPPLEY